MIYQKYRVTGRVQGVFYRQATQQKATQLGITGWVQNLPNGDVLVYLKGESIPCKALEDWLKIGPPSARVSELIILALTPEEITQLNTLSDFSIVR
jgi:acylphosphatase